MKTHFTSFLFSFLLLGTQILTAQTPHPNHICGTPEIRIPTPYHAAANQKPNLSESNTILYIPVTANFIGNDDGTNYASEERFLEALCRLNMDFEEYDFYFYLENVKYIKSSAFNDMSNAYIWSEAMYQFIADNITLNTMNVFIIEQAGGTSFVSWEYFDWDYSTYPPPQIHQQKHSIVLDRDQLQRPHLFTHEAGHYFGLYHTFEGGNNNYFEANGTPDSTFYQIIDTLTGDTLTYHWLVERVDGLNCDISGDLICDTPPDYLNFWHQCNSNKESHIVQTDPTGETFRTDDTNYMTYSNENICQDKFTPMQVNLMRSVAEGPKEYLLNNQTPPDQISISDLTFNYPVPDDIVSVVDSVTLEWDLPDADFYILDFGKGWAPNVHFSLGQYFVTENEFTVAVEPSKQYYWSVRAGSFFYPCETVADTSYFVTSDAVDVQEEQFSNQLNLYPNPTNTHLQIELPNQTSKDLQISIQSINGATFKNQFSQSGQSLDVSDFEPGMYFLRVDEGGVSYFARFVKH